MSVDSNASKRRTRLLSRLTLSHGGRVFLERWGLVHDRLGGFYLHHLTGPDPGMDLHDHPWAFVSVILKGGYTEQEIDTATAVDCAALAHRQWHWLSVHRMPLTSAHRITTVRPGTWTLVLREPTRRRWGFYMPSGWVDWEQYPYDERRPCLEVKR